MEEVKVCRICLVMDVQMYDLDSHPINSYLRFVTGSNLPTIENCPPLACFECVALVKKFHSFKWKSLKSQDLLKKIMDQDNKITSSKLKEIDRQDLGLSSNLNTFPIPDSVILHCLSSEMTIKEEPIQNTASISSATTEVTVKEEPIIENIEPNLTVNSPMFEMEIQEPIAEYNGPNVVTNPPNFEIIIKEEPILENVGANIPVESPVTEITVKEESITENVGSNKVTCNIEVISKKEQTTENPEAHLKLNPPSLAMMIQADPLPMSFEARFINTLNSDININQELPSENPGNFTLNSLISKMITENIRSNLTTNPRPPKMNFKGRPIMDRDFDLLSPDVCLSSDEEDSMPLLMVKERRMRGEDYNYDEDNSHPTKKKKRRTSRRNLLDEIGEHITITKPSLQEQIDDMNRKKDSFTYINSPFKCELCSKGFIDKTAWERHRRHHLPNGGDIKCQICKIWFKRKHSMRVHMSRHETKYACNYCSHVSTDPNMAKNHLSRQHKGVKYTCKHCGDTSELRALYIAHLRTKHPPEFTCNICGDSYISKKGLRRHKIVSHKDIKDKDGGIIEDGIDGEESEVNSISITTHKQHAEGSSKDASNDSSACGETYDGDDVIMIDSEEQSASNERRNKLTTARSKWPAKCEHCSQELKNGRDHWFHFRRHHPDKKLVQKNYTCDICEKTFTRKSSVDYHKRTHSGERPYKCSQCGKAFGKLFNLQQHEKLHSDDCPYVCQLCNMAFKFPYALKRHVATHNDGKPFQCETCNKTFTTASHRKVHINTVHLGQRRRT